MILVLRILGIYTLEELKRKNWDAIGRHQARLGKDYIDRYVRCLSFIILFGQRYPVDAESEVPVMAIPLNHSLFMDLHWGRLRGSQLSLKTTKKTQTRYHPDSLRQQRIILSFSDPQLIGVRNMYFNKKTVIKVSQS